MLKRSVPLGAVVPAAAERAQPAQPGTTSPPSELSPSEHDTCLAIGRALHEAKNVVLATHVNPDGDGLGAQSALAAYLQRRGVAVRILNADPPPAHLRFLETDRVPLGVFRGVEEDRLSEVDLVVMLDTGLLSRLGQLGDALPRLDARRICIDHHVARGEAADLSLVDPSASSTAELVYRLLLALGAELDPEVAIPLYVGLAFDTGGFSHANTTPEAHMMAADLLRSGADPESLHARMFASYSPARVRLWGRALSRLELEEGGRIAWMVVDREMLADTGGSREDLEGLAEQGRRIRGVEVAILFREDAAGRTKVSFRSTGGLDVNVLAGRFGGGGHANAAGATLPLPLGDGVARVLQETRSFLDEDGCAQGRPLLPEGSTH